jgi:ATP-dependent helicase Lhr and Lhr-like helicase
MTLPDFFAPATRAWFESTFVAPTDAQRLGWQAIAAGSHTLIHAPTGSGKTLAAFLWALDRLAAEPTPDEAQRCRVLYVSPMKALAYDIERNLRAPLTGIRLAAAQLGEEPPEISVAMRTGDTPSRDRQAMLRHPPDIAITTPESLYLMLTSQARSVLSSVRWVIVDEVHSVASSKRGSHLALSLERLDEQVAAASPAAAPPQRIGLSATQRPLSTIGEFLGGGEIVEGAWRPRPVTIVDAPGDKMLDLEIVVPVADMTRPEATVPAGADGATPRSIWPAVYPSLLEQVLRHRSTIIFVNSRGAAERLAAELNRLAGEELARSHHGSVSREQRVEIESSLKQGELRAVVATSTLELGIDMAAVDLVLLVESPASVASGLQRVGRAGHQVGAPSVARIYPKHRADLLEATVVVDRMLAGAVETTVVPRNPLDVLAQQLVAMVTVQPATAEELYGLVRRATPYRDLGRASFDGVLDMLAGRYPSDEFAELRPRIVWDRATGSVRPRDNAKMLAVTNPGTIPDRGLYTVVLAGGGRVGELDEEMVYESRPGDVFVLGSTSWRIDDITHDRVVVVPAPGQPAAKLPFWHGDAAGRPVELGRAVGEMVRRLGGLAPGEVRSALTDRYRLDPWAADNLAGFLDEEREATGVLPTDRTVVVERFRDEIGDWRMVVLSPFGARVHAPWALAARHRLRREVGSQVDVIWSDDGIVFRFPDLDEPPPAAAVVPSPDEIEELLLEEVADSALFTSRFREAAARALLLPRRRPGSRTPLWQQRRRAAGLLEVAAKHPDFPIVLETYREVLQDHFDLPALTDLLGAIAARRVRVHEVELNGPSPFASSLMFDFVASFMYEYDAPVAERRAAALTLDRRLLAELLGDPDLRDLLDPAVIAQVELELQLLDPDRKARSADAVHDALRHLGPLTQDELQARVEPAERTDGLVASLVDERRVVPVVVHGSPRLAAVEDLARLRDALGVAPPPGVPATLLEPATDPLGDLVGRYARTHGPFTVAEAAGDLGTPAAVVAEVLDRLAAAGRVTSGGYRSGAETAEWVDVEVLRRIRRRSLAVLRAEVEAVDVAALGRFLPVWHGIGTASGTPQRLHEVVRQLQGASIAAGILESAVLPRRLAYSPSLLDALLASGEVVWIGRGPLAGRDGRVALYLRSQVAALTTTLDVEPPDGDVHDALRAALAARGASFFPDLVAATGGAGHDDVLEAIWDLVWAGDVTNDTFAPVRGFLGRKRSARSGRPRPVMAMPAAASGRWYLTADLIAGSDPVTAEERAGATAGVLLDRHGVVTRDTVLGEGVPGGFAGLYPVFTALEDVGRVRRGYFIDGLGGSQFALPGAVDRLRRSDAPGMLVLAAADPANVYGSTVPWPAHPTARPARRGGAWVILVDGALAGFVEGNGRAVSVYDGEAEVVVNGLVELAEITGGRLTVGTVDAGPATGSVIGPALAVAGFVPGYRGLTYTAPRRTA